jgi:hypothetical protein
MVSIICFSLASGPEVSTTVACVRERVNQGAHPLFAPALKEPAGGRLNDDIVILKSFRQQRAAGAPVLLAVAHRRRRVSNIQPKRRQNRQILLHGMQLVMLLVEARAVWQKRHAG